MGKMAKNLGLYLVMIVLVVSLVNMFLSPAQSPEESELISYSTFMNLFHEGKLERVSIEGELIEGTREASGSYNSGRGR